MAEQAGKQSQMVPTADAKPPAEAAAPPDGSGSTADVGGLAHPFLEKRSSSPPLAYFEMVLQAPFSLG